MKDSQTAQTALAFPHRPPMAGCNMQTGWPAIERHKQYDR